MNGANVRCVTHDSEHEKTPFETRKNTAHQHAGKPRTGGHVRNASCNDTLINLARGACFLDEKLQPAKTRKEACKES